MPHVFQWTPDLSVPRLTTIFVSTVLPTYALAHMETSAFISSTLTHSHLWKNLTLVPPSPLYQSRPPNLFVGLLDNSMYLLPASRRNRYMYTSVAMHLTWWSNGTRLAHTQALSRATVNDTQRIYRAAWLSWFMSGRAKEERETSVSQAFHLAVGFDKASEDRMENGRVSGRGQRREKINEIPSSVTREQNFCLQCSLNVNVRTRPLDLTVVTIGGSGRTSGGKYMCRGVVMAMYTSLCEIYLFRG